MLETKEGQPVPSSELILIREGKQQKVDSKELLTMGKNVLFALPGAFTPTCSSYHVPGYNVLSEDFKRLGIEHIYCLSVNDPYVLAEWQRQERAHNVDFLSDSVGEFSKALGFLVDRREQGMGFRSWRYSMFIENGKIKKMFVEPKGSEDPFEVSDAQTMLRYLGGPDYQPRFALFFGKEGCPYCKNAKQLLKQHGYRYDELLINENFSVIGLESATGSRKTPQIFIGGKLVGGSQELEKYLKTQKRAEKVQAQL